MKTLLFATLVIYTLSCASAQEKNDTIRIIDQKVMYVNLFTDCKIITLSNGEFLNKEFIEQQGHGYGQMTGYLRNDTIYKIREHIGIRLMHDIATTDYYFWDGKLIYVNESEKYGTDIFIDSSGTVDYKLSDPDFEGHYYFFDDRIVDSRMKGQQKILPNEKYFLSQSKDGQLLHSAKKYIDLISDKKNQ
ncbi:MAG: hypothetical protein ABIJ97_05965 [Bacteroidota bacterium]